MIINSISPDYTLINSYLEDQNLTQKSLPNRIVEDTKNSNKSEEHSFKEDFLNKESSKQIYSQGIISQSLSLSGVTSDLLKSINSLK